MSVAETADAERVVDIAEPKSEIGIVEFEESFVRIAVVEVVAVGYCLDWHWDLIQTGRAIARVTGAETEYVADYDQVIETVALWESGHAVLEGLVFQRFRRKSVDYALEDC